MESPFSLSTLWLFLFLWFRRVDIDSSKPFIDSTDDASVFRFPVCIMFSPVFFFYESFCSSTWRVSLIWICSFLIMFDFRAWWSLKIFVQWNSLHQKQTYSLHQCLPRTLFQFRNYRERHEASMGLPKIWKITEKRSIFRF